MKAKIEAGGNEWYLTLIPETQDDEIMIGVMGRSLVRDPHKIYCREIGYMQPNLLFNIEKENT